MPAPISVIIPTLNAANKIGPTLACLYEGMEQSLICEVIFADGGSTDNIEKVATDVGAVLVKSPTGRGSQLRAGAATAKGRWLLFIHADTVLSAGWGDIMKTHLSDSDKAGYCKLAFDADGFAPRWIAVIANARSRLFGLPYGDQALLISKQLYQNSGGYPDLPLMEDVALAQKLRGQLMSLPIVATTGAERYMKDGWFTRSCKNLSTLVLYFMGVSPQRLAKRYRR